MMVDTQVRPSDVTKFPIIDAMLSHQREDLCPRSAKREAAYVGENLEIGMGGAFCWNRALGQDAWTLWIFLNQERSGRSILVRSWDILRP